MKITYIECFFVKVLKKLYEICKKLNILFAQKFFYYFYFKLLEYFLYPYLNKALNKINNKQFEGIKNSNVIWIFWWQGYQNMPSLVKQCYKSVCKYSNKHKVILITKRNINKYVDIPKFIYCKVHTGQITLTHFSDILRFKLLYQRGGLWCDSTMLCTSNINDSYFNYLYTSGGYTGTDPKYVAGRWTGFLIGGNKHNALFLFMCEYFELYWKKNQYQLDYFLVDLGLYYAYTHNIGGFKKYVDNEATKHNPCLFRLAPILNNFYNENIYKALTKNTNMFKLTYKIRLNIHKTFYSHILLHKNY